VEIRSAAPPDAPAIAGLLTELGYPATPEDVTERLNALIRSDADCVLLVPGGLIALHRIPRLAEGDVFARITALVVAPERRGQGVGRVLLDAAEEVARGWGCTLLEVSSGRRPERRAAHAFYRAAGFEETESRSVRYWKRLGQS